MSLNPEEGLTTGEGDGSNVGALGSETRGVTADVLVCCAGWRSATGVTSLEPGTGFGTKEQGDVVSFVEDKGLELEVRLDGMHVFRSGLVLGRGLGSDWLAGKITGRGTRRGST